MAYAGCEDELLRGNEAAYVLWDEVQEVDCSICKSIEPFKEQKFNKTCKGAWKKEDEMDYG